MTGAAPAVISAQDVSRTFGKGRGEYPALSKVSIEVRSGEVVLIFGPSGCGKSTLLSILGGLDRAYQGRVCLFGQDLAQLSDRALSELRGRRIGFVFQAFHLLSHLSVLDNVTAPALFGDGSDSDEAVRQRGLELLERVDLAGLADRAPAELSGGQRQRVAIARALLQRPDLLLCDEPTGNLDSETGERIIDLFEEIAQELSGGLVIVTHEERLSRIASRRISLLDGRVVGTPRPSTSEPAPAPDVVSAEEP